VNLKVIGTVRSCYKQKFGTPRQPGLVSESYARLVINPEFQPELSLQGLGSFSHIWVIWGFHQNTNLTFHAKVHPPRLNGEPLGVFATRSPHRPNPIGLSLVTLEQIENPNILWVKGIDFIDETPIYDIKPYLREIESVKLCSSGWVTSLDSKSPEIEIGWDPSTEKNLMKWQELEPRINVRNLVEQTLKLDPRPIAYKKKDANAKLIRGNHAIRIGQADVHFRFINDYQVQIFEIKI